MSLTEDMIARRPPMARPICQDAAAMAGELDRLWSNLHGLVQRPDKFM